MPVRHVPDQGARVETGPVQFGSDWCGVFIRGDNAFMCAMDLERVLEHVQPDVDPVAIVGLRVLCRLLRQSDARTSGQQEQGRLT